LLSKNPVDFSDKEMAACCAHNFEPMAQNSTTSRLSGFFPHAHIAVKNDPIFSPAGASSARFFDKLTFLTS
jgi:hypothetical protein